VLTLWTRLAAILTLLSLSCLASNAQTPSPAASGPNPSQDNAGFYPGWMLGTRFEGSTSGDGSVYDLGMGAGYNFSHRFGVDLGIPYFFVGTPTAVKGKNPTAVSGNGLGDLGANIRFFLPGKATITHPQSILVRRAEIKVKGSAQAMQRGIGQITSSMDGATSRRTLTPVWVTAFLIRAISPSFHDIWL
jgi:hypothetical protein